MLFYLFPEANIFVVTPSCCKVFACQRYINFCFRILNICSGAEGKRFHAVATNEAEGNILSVLRPQLSVTRSFP